MDDTAPLDVFDDVGVCFMAMLLVHDIMCRTIKHMKGKTPVYQRFFGVRSMEGRTWR